MKNRVADAPPRREKLGDVGFSLTKEIPGSSGSRRRPHRGDGSRNPSRYRSFARRSPRSVSAGLDRLINAFGSPNNCNSWEICAWHRQFARAFTTGTSIGMPDYAQAGCILLWGHNPSASLLAGATRIAEASTRGAKLIVVDPRHVGFAVKADRRLPVRPGTDAALALAIADGKRSAIARR